jgi:hypothetical protein
MKSWMIGNVAIDIRIEHHIWTTHVQLNEPGFIPFTRTDAQAVAYLYCNGKKVMPMMSTGVWVNGVGKEEMTKFRNLVSKYRAVQTQISFDEKKVQGKPVIKKLAVV